MPTNFFVDWALWEKMIFILAGAIVVTLALGFGKLWWQSRRNKKHAIVDEEKRVEVQQIRMSNRMIDPTANKEVPFGIRALESGVEIDGIWVSRSNTPIPESLKSLRDSERSNDSAASSRDSESSISSGERSPPKHSNDQYSGLPLPTFRQSRMSFDGVPSADTFPAIGSRTSSRHRDSAYKPKRSSQLRFSSYGDMQIHKDTLSQLEGVIYPEKIGRAHQERGSYAPIVVYSSSDAAADNERSSGTESDGTLSDMRLKSRSNSKHRGRPSSAGTSKQEDKKGKCRKFDESADIGITPSTGNYFSALLDSPPRSLRNSFTNPEISPILTSVVIGNTNRLPAGETEALGETQWPLLHEKCSQSLENPVFTPGTLHVNKNVRKVNSGFELLPAGTFDVLNAYEKPTSDERGHLVAPQRTEGERRAKRLQKKRRDTLTGSRASNSL